MNLTPVYSRLRKVFPEADPAAVENAGAQMITLALRRANAGGVENILDYIPRG